MTQSEATRSAASVEATLLARIFEPLIYGRLAFVTILVAMLGWALIGDPSVWRNAALIGVGLGMTAVSGFEWYRIKTVGISARWAAFDFAAMAILQTTAILATGGLESPILPAMIPLAAAVGFVAERRVTLALVLGLQVPALWIFVWLDQTEALGHLVPPAWSPDTPASAVNASGQIVAATAMSVVLVVGSMTSYRGRSIARNLLRQVLAGRDRVLADNRARSEELTRLNAEIAHELKNPLATIKGLSALLARQMDGTAGERLSVLRREADRMQEVLDTFLNFSRPLVPLDLQPVQLDQLVLEVCQLHEGIASERGIRLTIESSSSLHVECDARKIRQVLINLLQNALDAGQSEVRLRWFDPDTDPERVHIEIVDDGPGIAERVRGRVFEAGVTSKSHGSGLGLAIARGLVEQHEGDLALLDRDPPDHGCIARIQLPRQGSTTRDPAPPPLELP